MLASLPAEPKATNNENGSMWRRIIYACDINSISHELFSLISRKFICRIARCVRLEINMADVGAWYWLCSCRVETSSESEAIIKIHVGARGTAAVSLETSIFRCAAAWKLIWHGNCSSSKLFRTFNSSTSTARSDSKSNKNWRYSCENYWELCHY